MLAKLAIPISNYFKRLLIVLCIVLFTALLAIFVFRNTLVIWVSELVLEQGTSIECLDFDIGNEPLLVIHSACVRSGDVQIQIKSAEYFVGEGFLSKPKFLNQAKVNIASIAVLHEQSKQPATPIEDPQTEQTDLWSLPDSIPLIAVNQITLNSYLLQQPITIAITQPNRSELAISGDINANLQLGVGEISGDLLWSGDLLLSKSKQIESLTEPYQAFVEDWAELMKTQIHSRFQYTGATISSQHSLALQNAIKLASCSLPLNLDGQVESQIGLTPWQIEVDLSALLSQITLSQCVPEMLAHDLIELNSLKIDIPEPIVVSSAGFTTASINLTSDSVQTPLIIQLSNIELNEQNEAQLDYQLTLQKKHKYSGDSPQSFDATFKFETDGNINQTADRISIISDNTRLIIDDLASEFGDFADATSELNYSLSKPTNQPWQLTGDVDVSVKQYSYNSLSSPLSINSIKSQLILAGSSLQQLEIDIKTNVQGIKYQDYLVKTLSNQLTLALGNEQAISAKGKSTLSGFSSELIKLDPIEFSHQLNGQLTTKRLLGNHEFTLPSGLLGNLFHDDKKLTVLVPEQPVTYLNPFIQQVVPEISLITGKLALNLLKNNTDEHFSGNVVVDNMSFSYQDYQIINLRMDEPFIVDSSGIQLTNGNINIDEINVGIPMTQISASLSLLDNVAKLDFAKAQIIGGQITLTDFWLDNREQLLKLDLNDIDLKQLVDLQNQQGIEVSGEVSGDLPIYFTSGFSTIENGSLSNDGPGILKITDNPAFNAIKQQQKELAFLENVEFSKLSSEVSLSDDGWLDLKIGISGINPDKNREINFNYTHKENIFTLFKSLRITNSVQNSIEKRLQQRLLNKDKNL